MRAKADSQARRFEQSRLKISKLADQIERELEALDDAWYNGVFGDALGKTVSKFIGATNAGVEEINDALYKSNAPRSKLVKKDPPRTMRRNPPLVVFGNPGGRGKIMSHNVLAIAYIHADDDQPYVHGFGDAPVKLKTARDGTVTIKGLVDRTGVAMEAMPDGTVRVFGLNGQEVWDDREPE